MKTGSTKEWGSTEVAASQASVGLTSSQATASTIAHKYRRALKNGTGIKLTLPELQLLAHLGALDLVSRAENEELTNWQEILARSSSRTTGSTNAAMGRLPASGGSPQSRATDDRLYIKALGLAT
jgi:hypothetical protein